MRHLLLGLALPLLASTAFAQDPRGEVRVETFDDELVGGDLLRPAGEDVHVLRRHRGPSLIQVRENFHPEMVSSVEDL